MGKIKRLLGIQDRIFIGRDEKRQAFWGVGIRQETKECVQGRVTCPDMSELRGHVTKDFEY